MPATDKWITKIRLQTLLIFCGVLFAVFFVMSWSSYQVASGVVNKQIEQNTLPLTSDNIYSQIQRDLVTPMFIATMMAHDTFVRDWALQDNPADEPMQRYLNEINQRFGTFLSFFILEKDNRYILPDQVQLLDEVDPNNSWLAEVRALPATRPYTVKIGHDPHNHDQTDIYIDHLVYDYQGQQIGITGVGLSVDEIRRLITKYQSKYERVIYFVDKNGDVTLRGRGQKVIPLKQREGAQQIIDKLFSGEQSSYSFDGANGRVFVNVRFVEEFDWYLIVEEHDKSKHHALFSQFLINVLIALGITLVVMIISYLTQSKLFKRLAVAATADPLTGASNRRSAEMTFNAMRKAGDAEPLALMVLDIDHFKQINDQHGHDAGDIVLKKLVEHCRTHVRQTDVICRWGGEEFVMLFSQCEQNKAHELAERIRQGVEQLQIITGGKRLNVTISAGLAMVNDDGSLSDWVNRADEALYRAKNSGRNHILWWLAEDE